MMNNDKAEKKLAIIQNEIKALKASLPIAGSLLDVYFYNKTASGSYPDGTTVDYKIEFIPDNPSNGLGLTEIFYLTECNVESGPWAQYNPVFLTGTEGYFVNSNGSAESDDGVFTAGFGTFEVKVTVSVYSTVPGHIEITMP